MSWVEILQNNLANGHHQVESSGNISDADQSSFVNGFMHGVKDKTRATEKDLEAFDRTLVSCYKTGKSMSYTKKNTLEF